jgi:NAD-dependent SIR2 family protein deacetylase
MDLKERYVGEDFTDFLKQVLADGHLSDVSAVITKQVIDKGTSSLSERQMSVFETHVIDVYVTEKCNRCASEIPWNEMYGAHNNGGKCSACYNYASKDD